MEEPKPSPPKKKKTSLLGPMLLWPLAGVPVFSGLNAFWAARWRHARPHHDVGLEISAALLALFVAMLTCAALGAAIGYRFAKRTRPDTGFPLGSMLLNGFLCALLCLVYNFGGCMLMAIGTAH